MNHKCPHCTVVCLEQITSRVRRFFCRGELRTELDFLLLQRAHFWHHFWFYLFLSLNSGNEVSSVRAVCFSKHFFLLSVSALYSLLVLTKTNKKTTHTHTQNPICVWRWNPFLLSTRSCFLQINVCLISWKYDTITKFPVSSSHMTTGRQMLRIHLIQASGYTDTFSCNSWRKKCFLAI